MRGLFVHSCNFENLHLKGFIEKLNSVGNNNKSTLLSTRITESLSRKQLDIGEDEFNWWCKYVLSNTSYLSLLLNCYHEKVILKQVVPSINEPTHRFKIHTTYGFETYKHSILNQPWVCPCKDCKTSMQRLLSENHGFWYSLYDCISDTTHHANIFGVLTVLDDENNKCGANTLLKDVFMKTFWNYITTSFNGNSNNNVDNNTNGDQEEGQEHERRKAWQKLVEGLQDEELKENLETCYSVFQNRHCCSTIPTTITSMREHKQQQEEIYSNSRHGVEIHSTIGKHQYTILELTLQKCLQKAEEANLLVSSTTSNLHETDSSLTKNKGYYVSIFNSAKREQQLLTDYIHIPETPSKVLSTFTKEKIRDLQDFISSSPILVNCAFTPILERYLSSFCGSEVEVTTTTPAEEFMVSLLSFFSNLNPVVDLNSEKDNNYISKMQSLSSFRKVPSEQMLDDVSHEFWLKTKKSVLGRDENVYVYLPTTTTTTTISEKWKEEETRENNHDDVDSSYASVFEERYYSNHEKQTSSTYNIPSTNTSSVFIESTFMLELNRNEIGKTMLKGKTVVLTLGALVVRMYLSLREHIIKIWDHHPMSDIIPPTKKMFMVLDFLGKLLLNVGRDGRTQNIPSVLLSRWKETSCLRGDLCYHIPQSTAINHEEVVFGKTKLVERIPRQKNLTSANYITSPNTTHAILVDERNKHINNEEGGGGGGSSRFRIPVCSVEVDLPNDHPNLLRQQPQQQQNNPNTTQSLLNQLNDSLSLPNNHVGLSESMVVSTTTSSNIQETSLGKELGGVTIPIIPIAKGTKRKFREVLPQEIPPQKQTLITNDIPCNHNKRRKKTQQEDEGRAVVVHHSQVLGTDLQLLFQLYYHIVKETKYNLTTAKDIHPKDVGSVYSYTTNILWTDYLHPIEQEDFRSFQVTKQGSVAILADSLMASFID